MAILLQYVTCCHNCLYLYIEISFIKFSFAFFFLFFFAFPFKAGTTKGVVVMYDLRKENVVLCSWEAHDPFPIHSLSFAVVS